VTITNHISEHEIHGGARLSADSSDSLSIVTTNIKIDRQTFNCGDYFSEDTVDGMKGPQMIFV
jgi:hypothetical protein